MTKCTCKLEDFFSKGAIKNITETNKEDLVLMLYKENQRTHTIWNSIIEKIKDDLPLNYDKSIKMDDIVKEVWEERTKKGRI
jgi:hypothetical protein